MEQPLRIEDREAIRTLVSLYNHYYDDKRLDEFAHLVAKEGTLQLGPGGKLANGPDDIMASLSGVETPGLRHFTTDLIISFTGEDQAEGISRFAVHSAAARFDGTYHDTYIKKPDGWKFLRRTIAVFED